MRLLALIGVAFVLLVLVSIFGERKPPSDPGEEQRFQTAVATAAMLRSRMRNPDSFVLESVLVTTAEAICYEHRAQNGFGGMTRGYAVLSGAQEKGVASFILTLALSRMFPDGMGDHALRVNWQSGLY